MRIFQHGASSPAEIKPARAQLMDVLYRRGRATAAEILGRATQRLLEEKKHVRHEEKDLRYVYLPVVPREKARRSAVAHLLETFFNGSAEQAVATVLDVSARDLTPRTSIPWLRRSSKRARMIPQVTSL